MNLQLDYHFETLNWVSEESWLAPFTFHCHTYVVIAVLNCYQQNYLYHCSLLP